ncbi:MAG: hypothetical protein C4B59_16055 [Candidatus Methanogaster sp.]|uniref:Uncharacterized protein n=1 Tax=Candidatus Methanogaster sp. TaxID=3386292 RepID=A0AC61KYH6_9EURY|nr:MAG: hypothetical protein C4B59_16055 [ANME-2 cluster archaeon]
MKAIKIMMIILLAVAACACIVPDEQEVPTSTPTSAQTPILPQGIADAIPAENLPGTFKLIALVDENTPGSMNITEEAMSTIAGNLSVGEIKAVQGVYDFEAKTHSVFVTVIECTDSMNAANAVENYKNNPDLKNPPSQTVSRFGKVTFNEHEATEVRRKPQGDGGIRYGYVWSNGNRVFIVEPGTDSRVESMELAQMTLS